MKTFTRESDDDLFPKGLFAKETRRAIRAIAILFAIIIRRDDKILASEALVAHEYFDKRFKASHYLKRFKEDKKVLRTLLKDYLKGKLPTFRDCALDVLKAGVSYEARLELLEYLFKTAYVFEGICDAEMVKLREIAQFLLIKEWDLLSLEYKYEFRRRESSDRGKESQRLNQLSESIMRQAYLTLGVKQDATDDEVKAAYREIVKVCHPDKLTEEAGSKEWEEKVVRFRHTVEAYHMVCGNRNIS
ncbi:MAG: DnaJ domain-containing protein [Paludibacteraceae bacterium]|nr:DnaJ domain-containing protein [Paludibacteraceae bacterium]